MAMDVQLLKYFINQPATIIYTSTSDSTSCHASSDGSITVNANSGTAPYTYILKDISGNIVSSNSTGIFTGLNAGIYNCEISDGILCVITDNDTVFEAPQIVDNAIITPISCNGGSDGSIMISPTGENDDFTYFWSVIGTNTTTANGLFATSYNLIITPTNGCPSEVFIYNMANYEPSPIVLSSIATDVSCYGLNDGSATVIATGGIIGYSYLWNDSLGQTTQTATNLSAGTYICIVTDANGCSTTGSVTINEPAEILPNLTAIHATCNGANNGGAQVSPTGVTGASFDVFYNGINYNANNFIPLVTGSYVVEVINNLLVVVASNFFY